MAAARRKKPSSSRRHHVGGKTRQAAASTPRLSPLAPRPSPRRRLPPALISVLSRLPIIGRRWLPPFNRRDVLGAVPFRNELIEWETKAEQEDAEPVVVLRVPRRQDRWGRLLNRLFEGPSHKQVVLDELGTDVWELCDGENTVEDLIRALARKHRLERREVEVSLTMYLQTLAKRGFIGLRLRKD